MTRRYRGGMPHAAGVDSRAVVWQKTGEVVVRGLAQTLVLTGAVRAPEMSAALSEVGDTPELAGYLVAQRVITPAQLAEAIALHTGHRYVDLANLPLDPSIIALVP